MPSNGTFLFFSYFFSLFFFLHFETEPIGPKHQKKNDGNQKKSTAALPSFVTASYQLFIDSTLAFFLQKKSTINLFWIRLLLLLLFLQFAVASFLKRRGQFVGAGKKNADRYRVFYRVFTGFFGTGIFDERFDRFLILSSRRVHSPASPAVRFG